MTDQTAAGLAEPSTVAYLVTGLARGEPSICFEDERGDYGDEDHMPIFEALVRKSDYAALLAQFEEQRAVSARMEADAKDAARWRRLVNASEMAFPVATIADDPENDHAMLYGRKRLEQFVDSLDEISDQYSDAAIDAAIASQQAGGKA